jgi:macrolide transport system ATP-binding/permease protein
MPELFRKIQYYFRRRQFEEELDEEMRHHLSLSGAPAQFGNVTLLKEDSRAMWSWQFWEQLTQDLRYAFRAMKNNRAFTALAVLSLALGIGANTAIYSFMDSILLRSLPVSDPESLVVLNWHAKDARWGNFVMHSINGSTYEDPKTGAEARIFPYPAFELLRNHDSLFASIFAYRPTPNLNITYKGQADVAKGEFVSGDYFRGLAIVPAAGRLIVPADDAFSAPAVAVLSFAFCQKRFGGPENAAGQTILINNISFIVAGAAPPGFFGVDPASAPDVYLPLHTNLSDNRAQGLAADFLDQNYYWTEMMGRLRPGVSMVQAQAELALAFHTWVATTATTDRERADLPSLFLTPGAAGLDNLRRRYSKPLYVLMTLVGLILAIACANVANLLLARAASKRREIALRLSVGAGRFRVIRQLLTESVLLASLGGALGVVLAIWGIRFLTLLLGNGSTSFTLHAELNWHVLAAATALSLLTGVLFGLAPALQSTRVDVISAMKETRAGQEGTHRSWWRINLSQVLIVGQIALSLQMLVTAGLFVRTLNNLQSIEIGFNRDNLLLFKLDARKAGHKDPEIVAFYGELQKRFSAIPGVHQATLSNQSLIQAGFGLSHLINGKPGNDADRMLVVGPSFFETMQIPLVAGRSIDQRDQPGSSRVAVVSEYFAKLNFGDENPLGQHVSFAPNKFRPMTGPLDLEFVGVAKNVRYGGLKVKVRPVMYVPYNQGFPQPQDMIYELRTAGNPLRYVNAVREIVHEADVLVPVSEVKTQVGEINQTINQEIVFAELCTAFAILALVIAGVGLYGTVSYDVARRTGEIGIRMALGAPRARVVRMILSQVIVLAAAGLAIGIPAAVGASRLVASFLYQMKPSDPLAIAAAVVILLAAAILAGYTPARRASRIDPMDALRHE